MQGMGGIEGEGGPAVPPGTSRALIRVQHEEVFSRRQALPEQMIGAAQACLARTDHDDPCPLLFCHRETSVP